MNNLFQSISQGVPVSQAIPGNQYGPSYSRMSQVINKGSLVRFNYNFVKPGHDPVPLVIVTDIWKDYIRGVNLHYLTFPYIKNLLQQYSNNTGFSYSNIKGQEYIVSAFRQYKRAGIRGIQKLDSDFLLNVLASVRSMDPTEVEAIRRSIREQIRKQSTVPATPTEEMPFSG